MVVWVVLTLLSNSWKESKFPEIIPLSQWNIILRVGPLWLSTHLWFSLSLLSIIHKIMFPYVFFFLFISVLFLCLVHNSVKLNMYLLTTHILTLELFSLELTFSHQVEICEGIIEYESQSRLWFALSLFSYDGLPNTEQLLAIRCRVCVFIHTTFTIWGHFP